MAADGGPAEPPHAAADDALAGPRFSADGGGRAGPDIPADGGRPAEPGVPADGGPTSGSPLSQSLRPRGPVELRLSHYERPYATVVTAAGELDLLTVPAFSAKVNELVLRRAGDIVVDLSEVPFVDSAGLQVLLSAQRRLARRARRLAVICPAGPARRVIELARLADVLGVVDSFSECEARLAASGSAD